MVDPRPYTNPVVVSISDFNKTLRAVKGTRAIQQAKLLTLEHMIKIDSTAQLSVGDWVQYVDPNLGTWVTAKITKKQKNFKSGEGITYECGDVGRTLSKETMRYFGLLASPPYSNPAATIIVPDPLPDGYMLPDSPLGVSSCQLYGTILPALPPILPDLPVMPPGAISTRTTLPSPFDIPLSIRLLDYQNSPINVTISQALNSVLACVTDSRRAFVGTVNIDAAIGTQLLTAGISKSGMSVAEWLNDILSQTEGGVWETDGNILNIFDFYSKPSVQLFLDSTYSGRDAKKVNKPIVENADIVESLDGKYEAVEICGRGSWLRWTQANWDYNTRIHWDSNPYGNTVGEIAPGKGDLGPGTGLVVNPLDPHSATFIFTTRLYLPHTNVSGQFVPAINFGITSAPQGQIALASSPFINYRFQYTDADGDHDVTVKEAQPDGGAKLDTSAFDYSTGIAPNTRRNQWYVDLPVIEESGFLLEGEDGPVTRPGGPTWSEIKARYTYYDGPFGLLQKTTDPRLFGEGTLIIQRPEFIKFIQPQHINENDGTTVMEPAIVINDTASLVLLMKNYREKHLVVDNTGKVTLNISDVNGGLISQIGIGSLLTDFGPDIRVRAMSFDFVKRTLELDVGSNPLRDFMAAAVDRVIQKALYYFNFRGKQYMRPDVSGFGTPVFNQDLVYADNVSAINDGLIR